MLSNGVSVVLFGLRLIATDSTQYWFLFWNLFLAWVPVLLAWILIRRLERESWLRTWPLILTVLWLGFLPNSFYLISDLIHLESSGDIGVLFDAVLFMSFIWNGAIAGILSMVLVHKALIARRNSAVAAQLMGITVFLTSFAIYLGRSLRWNTWDALVNPAGILFDVSERVVNPLDHPQAFVTTATFFVLISSIYLVVWRFLQLLQPKTKR